MPSLEALQNRYVDQNLSIFAINANEAEDQVSAFMNENGYTFGALLDFDGRITRNYGVTGLPTVFIIDRNSMITVRIIGGIDWDSPRVHNTIDSLLNS